MYIIFKKFLASMQYLYASYVQYTDTRFYTNNIT